MAKQTFSIAALFRIPHYTCRMRRLSPARPSFFLYIRGYPAILNVVYFLPIQAAEAQSERRQIMFRIICIAIGYLFGCFQTAYLITRHKISQDIRDFGTGNMGSALARAAAKSGERMLLANRTPEKARQRCVLSGLFLSPAC